MFYGHCLTTIFEHFDIEFTNTDQAPYSKHLEIDNKTLTKIKFILNKDGVWVPKDQIKEEVRDEEDEQQVGDDEFGNVFETPPLSSSPKDVGTSSLRFRMDDRLAHIEVDMSYLRESQAHILSNQEHMLGDLRDIKDIMTSLLSRYPLP